jgi:hypothetical protein
MARESGSGGGSRGRPTGNPRRMAKPGGLPGSPKNYAQRTVRKAGAGTSSNAWRPIISKEAGPAVRIGNVVKSISGRTFNLSSGTRGKSTRQSISDFNKKTNKGR